MGKSEKVQINEWMKSMLQQRWKKLQSCLLAQLIGHMCNRCHLSVSIVFIASLFLMAPFIHIHNWEQFKKEFFFYNVHFCQFAHFLPPKKSMPEMFALHANIAGYRILWQISYPARSTTQNMN